MSEKISFFILTTAGIKLNQEVALPFLPNAHVRHLSKMMVKGLICCHSGLVLE